MPRPVRRGRLPSREPAERFRSNAMPSDIGPPQPVRAGTASGGPTPPAPPLDNAYVLGYHGFVYTSAQVSSGLTVRHSAVVLLTADHTDIEVALRDAPPVAAPAMVVAPLVARRLTARDAQLLSVNV